MGKGAKGKEMGVSIDEPYNFGKDFFSDLDTSLKHISLPIKLLDPL